MKNSKEETLEVVHEETEKELNDKILEITMKIKESYPELSKYIEEMQETLPDQKHPDVTQHLKAYYESLNAMLKKYILEQSQKKDM
jgi:hypothetical protein